MHHTCQAGKLLNSLQQYVPRTFRSISVFVAQKFFKLYWKSFAKNSTAQMHAWVMHM